VQSNRRIEPLANLVVGLHDRVVARDTDDEKKRCDVETAGIAPALVNKSTTFCARFSSEPLMSTYLYVPRPLKMRSEPRSSSDEEVHVVVVHGRCSRGSSPFSALDQSRGEIVDRRRLRLGSPVPRSSPTL